MAIQTETTNPAQQPITNGGIISPEAWHQMTPEQRAAYPAEVQSLMNQQEALQQNGIPTGTVPIQPAAIPLRPNQDVVVPPTPQQMGQQPQAAAPAPMTLAESKRILRDAEEATGLRRDWYEFYKVSFTNSHDISSMIAGALIAGFVAVIVYGVVCWIRKD